MKWRAVIVPLHIWFISLNLVQLSWSEFFRLYVSKAHPYLYYHRTAGCWQCCVSLCQALENMNVWKRFTKAASCCSLTLAGSMGLWRVFILEDTGQDHLKHAWGRKVCCNKSKEKDQSDGARPQGEGKKNVEDLKQQLSIVWSTAKSAESPVHQPSLIFHVPVEHVLVFACSNLLSDPHTIVYVRLCWTVKQSPSLNVTFLAEDVAPGFSLPSWPGNLVYGT